jgi:hypothetical protein
MVMISVRKGGRAGRAPKESDRGRQARVGLRSHQPVADAPEHGGLGAPAAITATHKLLTRSWTADVEALEAAIGHFPADRTLTNDSQIVFFELARDADLHVNITHKYSTKPVSGWAGPGSVPAGFVYNRTFGDTQRGQMIRHIRNMVFAARS